MILLTLGLGIYFALVTLLAGLALHRGSLAHVARRGAPAVAPPVPASWPRALVQIPIYNEAFVAARAIDAAARLAYPRDRLEIQVLDDSDDDSRAVVAERVRALAASGVPIRLLHRSARVGFKAGALAAGLAESSAERVAIFDADFVPPSDFLTRAIATLEADPGLGLVQGRWAHANAEVSALTRAQALFLDAHFSVEHAARARRGHPFNFNGTAGVWRRDAIEDGGGWSADTVTEDLDLSYRALLAGWRFAYDDSLAAAAELPESWLGFRAQQARWTRGGAETARKLLGRVWRAPSWSLAMKREATLHLLGNVAYLLLAALALLLPAALLARWLALPGGSALHAALDLGSMGIGVGGLVYFYATAAALRGRRLGGRELAAALAIGVGMSLSNAIELLRAIRSPHAPFVRTPKRGEASTSALAARYRSPGASGRALVEALVAALHAATFVVALGVGSFGVAPFLALYAAGLGAVSVGTLREERARGRRLRASATIAVTSAAGRVG